MKEFVEKLREKADVFEKSGYAVEGIVKDYRKSADMIDGLYEKSNISGFVEKLIERLEEEKNTAKNTFASYEMNVDLGRVFGLEKAVEIVNQLAEEYNPSKSSDLAEQIADDLSKVLKEAKSMGCKEVKYFHHVPLENVEIVINALRAYKPKEKPKFSNEKLDAIMDKILDTTQEEPQTNFYSERFNKVM